MGRLKSRANSRQRRFDLALTARAGAVDWSILWFDPRREHSSAPTAKSLGRRAQGPVKAGRVFRGPPEGLGLDWPEHGGILDRIGAAGVATWQANSNRWL